MVYADEEVYKNKYLLGRKPSISVGFPFYARQASQVIDRYTFGRLNELDEIPEAVRLCCCELAEALYAAEKQRNATGGKTSEKIGTYSVTFGTSQEASAAAADRQREIVYQWLEDTGLCYQGVE